jgi:hypothetical protein
MSISPEELEDRPPIIVRWDDDGHMQVTDAPWESTLPLASLGTPGIEVDGDMIILGIPPHCVYQVTDWDPDTKALNVTCWQWMTDG